MIPFMAPMMMTGSKGVAQLLRTDALFNPTADTAYVVPAGATCLHIVGWAAAGGGNTYASWSPLQRGGGGGFVEGIIPVSAGETLSARVGLGGPTDGSVTNNGGGLPSTGPSAAGGGYTGLFRGSTPLIIAGGGGAGGALNGSAVGGPGGGLTAATVSTSGGTVTGGSQTAGGTATGSGAGTAGGYLQAGASGYAGGGGGYYGGSAIYTFFGSGGSSFIGSSGIINPRTVAGSGFNPGLMSHADYITGVGVGGNAGPGGNGRLVIRAYTDVPPLTY